MAELSGSVLSVQGIGPKKAALLEKLNIYTLSDILNTYPRDYEDRTRILPVADTEEGDKVSIYATVGTVPTVHHVRKGMDITRLTAFDSTGVMQIIYFNNKYVAAQLRQGTEYLFYGRVQRQGKQKVMISPVAERYVGEQPPGRIVPVYPLTAGIHQRDMERLARAALQCSDLPEDPF